MSIEKPAARLNALRAVKWPLDGPPAPDMASMVAAIPELDSLADLPAGTPVLLRGDVDVPVTDGRVMDDTRLRSMLPTIRFGIERGWRWLVLGHIGRQPELSLAPVAAQLAKICGQPVDFVPNWFDEDTGRLGDSVSRAIASQRPGSILILDNTRRFEFERSLWSVGEADFDSTASRLFRYADAMRDGLAAYLVNDGLSASNLDFSSCVLPFSMNTTCLGSYTRRELLLALRELTTVGLVVFSGVKANKLDDLEDVVSSRPLRMVIVGGALAMALCKARAVLDNDSFSYGAPEYDAADIAHMHSNRIAQARRVLERCRERGIQVVLPSDYRLDDGSVSTVIPDDRRQLDIGPETIARFEAALREYGRCDGERVAYLNGSVGVFEDRAFSFGTQAVIRAFSGLTDCGVKTFVGGGDGRAALLEFSAEDRVTHAFTAGGTILKVMKSAPIGYVASTYYAQTEK